jgi:hypothetical protein
MCFQRTKRVWSRNAVRFRAKGVKKGANVKKQRPMPTPSTIFLIRQQRQQQAILTKPTIKKCQHLRSNKIKVFHAVIDFLSLFAFTVTTSQGWNRTVPATLDACSGSPSTRPLQPLLSQLHLRHQLPNSGLPRLLQAFALRTPPPKVPFELCC